MQRRQFIAGISAAAGVQLLPGVSHPGIPSRQVWFCYDDNCGIDYYDTEEEALKADADCIAEYGEEEWDEAVHNVTVGVVTHIPRQKNVVTKEMLNEDSEYNGRYYGGGYDYWCDYEMEPVG